MSITSSPVRLSALLAILAASASPALAQVQTQPQPETQVDPFQAQSVSPQYFMQDQQQPVAPVVAPVQVSWDAQDARELLTFIEEIGAEGLDPADYRPAALRAAIDGRDQSLLDSVASAIFLQLSSDLSLGHVRGDARLDWFLKDDEFNGQDQYDLMARATRGHIVRDTLVSLLPTHPQYTEMKAVLAALPPEKSAEAAKIRANLDRWRWLPRDLGQKYVIVNVAAYSVALVEDGKVTARRRAVAGAPKTATPQLNATITGVIFNPWWEVPSSIAPEVKGKKGYVTVPNGDGVRYRQPPGPANALGRMKLVMPNDHAIYLHDTNAKGLFDKQARAFSHGCIRTEDALGFASILLEPTGQWDRAQIAETVKSGKTIKADLASPVPVYIVYFTTAAGEGGKLVNYSDIYSRDKVVSAALADSKPVALASN